jgi:protein gp37
MNRRFKFIADFRDPQFFLNRLTEPRKFGEPGRVFVVTMGDLFGSWVPDVWVHAILEVVEMHPEHTFMFLTKNPTRYFRYDFPENTMIGLTLTEPNSAKLTAFKAHLHPRKFLSLEPIMATFEGVDFNGIEEVIVGAMTGPKAKPPKPEWVESIKHHNVFLKDNIKKYL